MENTQLRIKKGEEMEIDVLLQNVTIAAFACVGLIETLKSFFKTEKKWIYAVVMIPLSVGCYFAVLYLPPWVIGGMLTVAACQIGYQTIVQTFHALVKMIGNKAAGVAGDKEILNQVQDDKQEEEK